MTSCNFCGATLPAGALFCGDCGCSVESSVSVKRGKKRKLFRRGPAVSVTRAATVSFDPPPSGESCSQCGYPLARHDVFCGDCGFISLPTHRKTSTSEDQWPEPDALVPPVSTNASVTPADTAPADTAPADTAPASNGAVLGPLDHDTEPIRTNFFPLHPAGASAATATEAQFTFWRASRALPARASNGQRYVLQFSSGESFTVFGTGLVGRNPRAEPGEQFDVTMPIIDRSRSVSNTHLEFGQTDGRFWVNDRFSGNGTTVREPDASPTRCTPGRRQMVSRGSRIDIGEQFFVVS
ncbi:MAG: zinc ribbon domain-containing protein [Microbacteriaceae bacterium]|nr:zinc ribbon domain-containing protein [Microbacteriaceae bacterium]